MSDGVRTEDRIWRALERVMDPEIPVISVVELGIIRDVQATENGGVQVTMTPTFSGCPALDVMRQDITAELRSLGFEPVQVKLEYDPPWTTDSLSERGREKLRQFGLAPPPEHQGNVTLALDQPRACPRCGGEDTSRKNSFGSTLCRSLYYCNNCQEPFPAFKPL